MGALHVDEVRIKTVRNKLTLSSSVREIQRINERELELGLHGSGSWHDQYKDSAYIYVGGLPYDLTEGDVLTIFSQYGEIVNIHLPKPREEPGPSDKDRRAHDPQESKKSHGRNRGFGFLMYEDQRSTVLAVDNLNGSQVLGRTLRVDHVANFKQERVRDAEGNLVEPEEQILNCAPPETVVDEDEDPEHGDGDADLEDPMAAYFAEKRDRERRKKRRRHDDDERSSARRHRERRRKESDLHESRRHRDGRSEERDARYRREEDPERRANDNELPSHHRHGRDYDGAYGEDNDQGSRHHGAHHRERRHRHGGPEGSRHHVHRAEEDSRTWRRRDEQPIHQEQSDYEQRGDIQDRPRHDASRERSVTPIMDRRVRTDTP